MNREELYRHIVERELKQTVHINDDQSRDSMYDLRIGNKERPEVAIECVGAVDEQHAALWGFVEKKDPPSGEFHGDWIVEVTPSASLNNIYRELGIVLFDLEQSRVFSATRDCWLERSNHTSGRNSNHYKLTIFNA